MGSKIELNPVKGARDFYPEDMVYRRYWESKLSAIVEAFGYEPFDGPILERLELFEAKTSEEIVSGQTYAFKDRGGRDVVIRPEMTPTFARMVAARSRRLVYPLRWYSFPNLWRYERPQKGRLREHWQLNCDLVAPKLVPAYELEMLNLICEIMSGFSVPKESYVIRFNHRGLCEAYFRDVLGLQSQQDRETLFYLVDRLKKAKTSDLIQAAQERGLNPAVFEQMVHQASDVDDPECFYQDVLHGPIGRQFQQLMALAKNVGVSDRMVFDPSVVRGFQYYTGLVFELEDRTSRVPRAILGGGRYDNLVGAFSNDPLQGVGFGLGDVTFRDFIQSQGVDNVQTYQLPKPWVLLASQDAVSLAVEVQAVLRRHGLRTIAVYESEKKLFKTGIRTAFRYDPIKLVVLGRHEVEKHMVGVKDVKTKAQEAIPLQQLDTWVGKTFAET